MAELTPEVIEQIQAINDKYFLGVQAMKERWPRQTGGGGKRDVMSGLEYNVADAEADVVAVLNANGIHSSDDLKQSVKGSHNDSFINLGIGNGIYNDYETGFKPSGGSSRAVNLDNWDAPIGSSSLQEAGQFEKSRFDNPMVSAMAAIAAPFTGGLSVIGQKALIAADGGTLHGDDWAEAGLAYAGGQFGGGFGGEGSSFGLGDAYDVYDAFDSADGKGGSTPVTPEEQVKYDQDAWANKNGRNSPYTDNEALLDYLDDVKTGAWESIFGPDGYVSDSAPTSSNPTSGSVVSTPPQGGTGGGSNDAPIRDVIGKILEQYGLGDISDVLGDVFDPGSTDAPTGDTGTVYGENGAGNTSPDGSSAPRPERDQGRGGTDDPGQTSGGIGDIFNNDIVKAGTDALFGDNGYFTRKDQDRDAARAIRGASPKPLNMNMPGFGNTSFNNGNINIDPSQQMQEFIDASSGRATGILNDPNQNQFIDKSLQFGNENIQQAMEGAINTESFNPYRDQFTENQQGVMDNLQNNEMLSKLDPQIQALFESGQWQNETGQGLIENSDFQFLADERLGLLRDQAQPYEQQQTNRLENSLAASGRAGGKGGAMDRGGLSLTQSTSDIERQLQSQTMADQMREFNIGAGTNLMQGGSNALTGSGQVFGIGANADANKASVGSNINQATLNGQVDATGAENTRMRNILSDVQGMFGTGQGAQKNQTGNASDAYNLFAQYMDDARKNVTTAANPFGFNTTSGPASVINQSGPGGQSGMSSADIGNLIEILKSL